MAKPLFRKIIFPWYYSKIVQVIIILAGLGLMFFAIYGLIVAATYGKFTYMWPPLVLLVFAAILVIIAIVRLKRTFSQGSARYFDLGY